MVKYTTIKKLDRFNPQHNQVLLNLNRTMILLLLLLLVLGYNYNDKDIPIITPKKTKQNTNKDYKMMAYVDTSFKIYLIESGKFRNLLILSLHHLLSFGRYIFINARNI